MMTSASKSWPARIAALLSVLIAAWIALDTLRVISESYSSLPFWDQWGSVDDYERFRSGHMGLADWFRQNNEHRIAFPRLIFMADFALFQGTDVFNLAAIIGFQVLQAALLIRLAGDLRRPLSLAAAALALALTLSIGQWENLVWGFQVQFVCVFALATAAFVLLEGAVTAGGARRIGLFAASAACLLLSAFSMANGMAAMAIAVVLALALGAPRWMPALLALLLAIVAAGYFHGYHPVAGNSTAAYALGHPIDYVSFVAAYLGNIASPLMPQIFGGALAGPGRPLAVVLGVFGLASAAASLGRTILRRGDDRLEAVLLAITAFIVVTAAVTALGRLNLGLEQAYAPRYRTPTGVFWAAQAIYWARAVRFEPSWGRAGVAAGITVLLGLLCLVQNQLPTTDIEAHRIRLTAAADALEGMLEDDALRGAFPEPQYILAHLDFLRREKLSVFAAPDADWLAKPIASVVKMAPESACMGALDIVRVPAENPRFNSQVSGWAWEPNGRHRPHRIILTNAAGKVAGYGTTGLARPDVLAVVRQAGSERSGWAGFAQLDGSDLRAFAILANGTACEVGRHAVTVGASRLLKIAPQQAGPDLAAPVSISGGWIANAPAPEMKTQTAEPRPDHAVYVSGSGQDDRKGVLTFGPFVAEDRGIALALLTGADTDGQTLEVKDAQTGKVLASLQPSVRQEWSWRRLRVPREVVGRPIFLDVRDAGAGAAQWMAVTAPRKSLAEP